MHHYLLSYIWTLCTLTQILHTPWFILNTSWNRSHTYNNTHKPTPNLTLTSLPLLFIGLSMVGISYSWIYPSIQCQRLCLSKRSLIYLLGSSLSRNLIIWSDGVIVQYHHTDSCVVSSCSFPPESPREIQYYESIDYALSIMFYHTCSISPTVHPLVSTHWCWQTVV